MGKNVAQVLDRAIHMLEDWNEVNAPPLPQPRNGAPIMQRLLLRMGPLPKAQFLLTGNTHPMVDLSPI